MYITLLVNVLNQVVHYVGIFYHILEVVGRGGEKQLQVDK